MLLNLIFVIFFTDSEKGFLFSAIPEDSSIHAVLSLYGLLTINFSKTHDIDHMEKKSTDVRIM